MQLWACRSRRVASVCERQVVLLSILIPALSSRPWHRVVGELHRQKEQCWFPEVEILYELGDAKSGVKRQNLMVRAVGDYVAFVDDDDELSSDYLRSLVDGCRTRVDVVAFNLRFRSSSWDGDETWKFGLWKNDRKKGVAESRMAANHLCAWRQKIARRVAWCPDLGNADDHLWFQPIHAAGLATSVYRIDRTLYYYQYDPKVTCNQRQEAVMQRRGYVGAGLTCYQDETGEIWIECGTGSGRIRNHQNTVKRITPNLKLFHTIKVPI